MGRGTARVAVVEGPRPCPSVSASRCHLPIAPRQGGLRTDPKFEGGPSGGTATLLISALEHLDAPVGRNRHPLPVPRALRIPEQALSCPAPHPSCLSPD